MNKTLLSLLFVAPLVGCSLSSYFHDTPEKVVIDNEKFINKPIKKVWENISGLFFSDTFTVESSDKNTGTIVATFKSDRPINYVDCGIVKRKYVDNDKLTHEFTYNYADSAQYGYEKDGKYYDAEVKASLIAKITAKIESQGEGTHISIDTQYTLNREETSTNQADKSKLPPEKEEIMLSTNEPYKTEEFSCIANGVIENNILSNIN